VKYCSNVTCRNGQGRSSECRNSSKAWERRVNRKFDATMQQIAK
uniref:Uncharacterized protein n=1 Tax=Anopheles atroparvus TaxID=41427 RepID=A0AAG5D4Q1_ANOAO